MPMVPNTLQYMPYRLLTLFLLVCAGMFAYLGFFNERPSAARVIYEYDLGRQACYILDPRQQEKYVPCNVLERSGH